MNKYRVIITDNQGSYFEKVYEVPPQAPVIDYLFDDSPLIHDLQDSEISIPDIIIEVYFESPIEIKDQESLILELQEKIMEEELNVNYLRRAIFNSLNEIGLAYRPGGPLPVRIKSTLLQLLSDNI